MPVGIEQGKKTETNRIVTAQDKELTIMKMDHNEFDCIKDNSRVFRTFAEVLGTKGRFKLHCRRVLPTSQSPRASLSNTASSILREPAQSAKSWNSVSPFRMGFTNAGYNHGSRYGPQGIQTGPRTHYPTFFESGKPPPSPKFHLPNPIPNHRQNVSKSRRQRHFLTICRVEYMIGMFKPTFSHREFLF